MVIEMKRQGHITLSGTEVPPDIIEDLMAIFGTCDLRELSLANMVEWLLMQEIKRKANDKKS